MGERAAHAAIDAGDMLAGLCRFNLTESNLKQLEEALSTAHVQSDEPTNPLLAAVSYAAVDGDMPREWA